MLHDVKSVGRSEMTSCVRGTQWHPAPQMRKGQHVANRWIREGYSPLALSRIGVEHHRLVVIEPLSDLIAVIVEGSSKSVFSN